MKWDFLMNKILYLSFQWHYLFYKMLRFFSREIDDYVFKLLHGFHYCCIWKHIGHCHFKMLVSRHIKDWMLFYFSYIKNILLITKKELSSRIEFVCINWSPSYLLKPTLSTWFTFVNHTNVCNFVCILSFLYALKW